MNKLFSISKEEKTFTSGDFEATVKSIDGEIQYININKSMKNVEFSSLEDLKEMADFCSQLYFALGGKLNNVR